MSIAQRNALQKKLFPSGIPRLWCPTLTHFSAARVPDKQQIYQHLAELAPFVKGILVPGSTGEGWEMSDEDVRTLLSVVLSAAYEVGIRVLIGVLKTDVEQVLATFDALSDFREHPALVGFTVCPPKGADLSQDEIANALRIVLSRGYPTALYQLPQVTLNEMTPETVAKLSSEFSNFILFKDTSGYDRVATSGLDFRGVFLVRGSESGGYARWPKVARGIYDGFLLSTANVFAPELVKMLELLDEGRGEEAKRLSIRLESMVTAAFAMVQDVPVGNAFSNANKLLYHVRTYGTKSLDFPPPLLYCGERLPEELVAKVQKLFEEWSILT